MFEIIPNWHPIFVHFAVALLLVAALAFVAAYLPFTARVREELRTVAHWTLWTGSVVALATVFTGWLAYNSVEHDDVSHRAMTDHRNWAIATTLVFVMLAIGTWWYRFVSRVPGKGVASLFMVALAAGIVLLTGTAWRGGELVYRYGLGVLSLPGVEAHGDGHDHAHTPSSGAEKSDIAKPVSTGHEEHDHKH